MGEDGTKAVRKIPKQHVLMILLGVDEQGVSDRGIGGITRLQKLLFLLWKEAGIEQIDNDFAFRPYKLGPYSRALYDELELLENLGYVRGEVQGEATEEEAAELEELSFEQLMGDDAAPFQDVKTRAEASTADNFEERRYGLTDKGLVFVRKLMKDADAKPFVDGIRKIKSRFARHSLQDLLYYIYTKYDQEGWASDSEIRDKVLRKGALH